MSTSRAIKRKTKRDDTPLSNYQPMPEKAPSIEREEGPTIARVLAMVGLFLTVLGTLAMFAHVWRRAAAISPDWGLRFATVGICLLIYHAFVERDLQFRRLYGYVGLELVIIGVALRVIAFDFSVRSFTDWFLFR